LWRVRGTRHKSRAMNIDEARYGGIEVVIGWPVL
jgi:hypothetical protein